MKNRFNIKAWIGTWTTLGLIGLIVPVVMVLDSKFDPNTALIVKEEKPVQPETPSSPPQPPIVLSPTEQSAANYYQNLRAQRFIVRDLAAGEGANLSDRSSITNASTIDSINNLLDANSAKLVAPGADLVGFVLQFQIQPANIIEGFLPVKIILTDPSKQPTVFYNANGTVGTAESAGEIVNFGGYRTLPSLVAQQYIDLQDSIRGNFTVNSASSTKTASQLAAELTTANAASDSATMLNTLKNSVLANFGLAPLFGQITNLGFKLHANNISPSDANGTLTFSLVLVSGDGTVYNLQGNPVSAANPFAGIAITVIGAATS
ncbi:hypothetical protein [[Mycoplasma] testudinis]|uniref:hypothetical protein n=1 Tax=[Mycoplasma] testudinis TaxID=33924 RepID=UPI00048302CB|nr:hypothetical protein [[Mycoplasma] testudinis]